MGSIILGILLKGLGFTKLIFEWIWQTISGIIKFAIAKPLQFLVIILSMALVWSGWYAYGTKRDLAATQAVVEEKVSFIKGQDIRLKEYVKALDVEKKNHVESIQKTNQAVASLKKTADAALARAQAAGRAAKKDQAKYDQLGKDYGRVNTSSGTAEQRIQREQETNDSFIEEWKKVSK
jgi:hypothetical protein